MMLCVWSDEYFIRFNIYQVFLTNKFLSLIRISSKYYINTELPQSTFRHYTVINIIIFNHKYNANR